MAITGETPRLSTRTVHKDSPIIVPDEGGLFLCHSLACRRFAPTGHELESMLLASWTGVVWSGAKRRVVVECKGTPSPLSGGDVQFSKAQEVGCLYGPFIRPSAGSRRAGGHCDTSSLIRCCRRSKPNTVTRHQMDEWDFMETNNSLFSNAMT
ncbi:hypothetical protein MMC07_003946 [Pseudocyphellaria aurata]|nr:hypothetical protein [Pseudocyphellaria aurata]